MLQPNPQEVGLHADLIQGEVPSERGAAEHSTLEDTHSHFVPAGNPPTPPTPLHTTSASKGSPGDVEAGATRHVVAGSTGNGKLVPTTAAEVSGAVTETAEPTGGDPGGADVDDEEEHEATP